MTDYRKIGVASAMPGTSGFTMVAFEASAVPEGTEIYRAPTPDEQAADKWVEDAGIPKFEFYDPTPEQIAIASMAKTVHRRIDELCEAANVPEGDYFDAATNLMLAVRQMLHGLGFPHALDQERHAITDLPEFIPSPDGQHALCTSGRAKDWIMYKHPDGQWVSLRRATGFEIGAAHACHYLKTQDVK